MDQKKHEFACVVKQKIQNGQGLVLKGGWMGEGERESGEGWRIELTGYLQRAAMLGEGGGFLRLRSADKVMVRDDVTS